MRKNEVLARLEDASGVDRWTILRIAKRLEPIAHSDR